jgi:hypothetical protein
VTLTNLQVWKAGKVLENIAKMPLPVLAASWPLRLCKNSISEFYKGVEEERLKLIDTHDVENAEGREEKDVAKFVERLKAFQKDFDVLMGIEVAWKSPAQVELKNLVMANGKEAPLSMDDLEALVNAGVIYIADAK